MHYLNFLCTNSNTLNGNYVTQECRRLKPKLKLRELDIKFSVLECLNNYSEVTSMIVFVPLINYYVINEDDNKYILIRFLDSFHKINKSYRCIGQHKGHDKKS